VWGQGLRVWGLGLGFRVSGLGREAGGFTRVERKDVELDLEGRPHRGGWNLGFGFRV